MAYIYPTAVTNVSDSFQDHVARGSVNPGTDYTSAYGDDVVSVAAGTVTDASNDPGGGGGRTVHVNHDDGTGADYLHLAGVAVSAGQWVAQGTRLGDSGASGYGDDWYYGAHLHISFRPNHYEGYGNSGNQDFNAIMAGQAGAAGPDTDLAQKEDIEMRIVTVPQGTIALVGEYTGQKYSSATGSQAFSYGSNMAAYGTSAGLTEDQVSTLVSEAATRRKALVADVAASVEASLSSTRTQAAPSTWSFIVGAVLILIGIIAVPILSALSPTAAEVTTLSTLANFLIGAGAIVVGFGLATLLGPRRAARHAERAGDDDSSD
jgi:hypothetical protein